MTTQAELQARDLENFVTYGDGAMRWGHNWGNPHTAPSLVYVVDAIRQHIQPGMRVVEIGSGGGRWTEFLSKIPINLKCVEGTPAGRALLEQTLDLSSLTSFEYEVCRDGAIQDQPATVDVVFSHDTFVHFHRGLFDAYLQSIGRILKPGGVMILHFARRYEGLTPEMEVISRFQYAYTDAEFSREMERADLTITVDLQHPAGGGSRFIVAKRACGTVPRAIG